MSDSTTNNPISGTRRKLQPAEEAYAGPLSSSLSSSVTISSNPVAPKRLRRQRGSSDEEQQETRDDDEITITDFRVGGPILCRLPVYGAPLDRNHPLHLAWEASMQGDVLAVLQKYQIECKEVHSLRRKSGRIDRLEADTILVLVEKRDKNDAWFRAAVEIRKICITQGLVDVSIEIADPKGLQPRLTFGVEADALILSAWDDLETQIMHILGETDWLALELLRRGTSYSPEENPVTVTITIDESSQADWVDIREEIVRVLDDSDHEQVAVEIIRGVVWRGSDDIAYLPADRAWEGPAHMGGSIGPSRSEISCGTLGGYLQLQQQNSECWETMVFTCFHVVLPDCIAHPSREDWVQNGILPNDSTNTLTIEHPSYSDHLRAVKDWQSQANQIQTSNQYTYIKAQLQDPDAVVLPLDKRIYDMAQTQLLAYNEKVRKAETFFATNGAFLGRVFAGSGMRQVSTSTGPAPSLDWALVKVEESRISANYLPTKEEASSFGKSSRLYMPLPTMTTIATPTMDLPLFKCGRTTGFTAGTYVSPQTTLLHSRKNTNQGKQWQISRDHSVAAIPKSGDFQPCFGRGGDSGAAVFTAFGQFAGMFFGGNDATNTSYFTSAQDLFGDIRRLTGAKAVRLYQGEEEL